MTRIDTSVRRAVSVVFGVCVLQLPYASAHHFFAPEYERELRGTIRGVVEQVRYVNPHVQVEISISATSHVGNPAERWLANTVSPKAVGERGWRRDSIEPGDSVTVEGFLGRDGATRVWIQSITLESGEVFYPVGRE